MKRSFWTGVYQKGSMTRRRISNRNRRFIIFFSTLNLIYFVGYLLIHKKVHTANFNGSANYQILNASRIDYRLRYKAERFPIHYPEDSVLSILLPCSSVNNKLKESLSSILYQRLSTYVNSLLYHFQVIVVFDEPLKKEQYLFIERFMKEINRKELKNRIQIKFVFKEYGGCSDAFNVGLLQSSGMWIMKLNPGRKLRLKFNRLIRSIAKKYSSSFQHLPDLRSFDIVAPAPEKNCIKWRPVRNGNNELLEHNIFHSSVIVQSRFYRMFDSNNSYSQWWKEPYMFHGLEDWSFWLNRKLFVSNTLYTNTEFVIDTLSYEVPQCKRETYLDALFRIANFKHYSKQSLWKSISIVLKSTNTNRFAANHSFDSSTKLYGHIFGIQRVWNSLEAVSDGDFSKAINEAFEALKSRESSIRFLLNEIKIGVIDHGGLDIHHNLSRLLESDFRKRDCLILIATESSRSGSLLEKTRRKVKYLREQFFFSKILLLQKLSISSQGISFKYLQIKDEMEGNKWVRGFSRNYKELLKHVGGNMNDIIFLKTFLDTSFLRVNEVRIEYESIVYSVTLNENLNEDFSLVYGWKENLFNDCCAERSSEYLYTVLDSMFAGKKCVNMFGDAVASTLCKVLIILFHPHRFGGNMLADSFHKASEYIPLNGFTFEHSGNENEPSDLRAYKNLLKRFLSNQIKGTEFTSHLKNFNPQANIYIWWIMGMIASLNELRVHKSINEWRTLVSTELNEFPYYKVNTCIDMFLKHRPNGQLFHQFISRYTQSSRLNMSLISSASILHYNVKATLILHTDSLKVQKEYERAFRGQNRIRFVPMCDSVLQRLESDRSIKYFNKRFSDGEYFYSHRTDLYRFLVLKHLGGVYCDTDLILFRTLAENGNFLGRESEYLVNGAVMKIERGSTIINHILDQFPKSYNKSVWACVGPELLTDAVRKHPKDIKVLNRRAFYPFHWSEVEKYGTRPISKKTFNRLTSRSYGCHIWGRMIFDLKTISAIDSKSLLGRVLSFEINSPVLEYIPQITDLKL